MAGRDISTTRLGLASTRIIGCCAIGGEAVGIAAALCNKYACDPRELAPHVKELQQLILKEDGFLPGFKNEDEKIWHLRQNHRFFLGAGRRAGEGGERHLQKAWRGTEWMGYEVRRVSYHEMGRDERNPGNPTDL